LNRNYGFKFGEGHSSKEECKKNKDDYRGPSAFSEPETQAMKNFLTQKKDEISVVFNFHCAGN